MKEMTILSLLEAAQRLGGDLSTTVIQVNGALLGAEDYELGRENGALVVTLLAEATAADQAGKVLRNDALYAKWRGEQHPKPAAVSAKHRGALADYLTERLGGE
jgi:hypothetical protein